MNDFKGSGNNNGKLELHKTTSFLSLPNLIIWILNFKF